MSVVINGRNNSIRVDITPDGYRIYPYIQTAPARFSSTRKPWLAGQADGSSGTTPAVQTPSVPIPAPLPTPLTAPAPAPPAPPAPPTTGGEDKKIVIPRNHLVCSINYSQPEKTGYFGTDLTGSRDVSYESIAKIFEYDLSTREKRDKSLVSWGKAIIPEDKQLVADGLKNSFTAGEY